MLAVQPKISHELISFKDLDLHVEGYCMCGNLSDVNVQTHYITQLVWPWVHQHGGLHCQTRQQDLGKL